MSPAASVLERFAAGGGAQSIFPPVCALSGALCG